MNLNYEKLTEQNSTTVLEAIRNQVIDRAFRNKKRSGCDSDTGNNFQYFKSNRNSQQQHASQYQQNNFLYKPQLQETKQTSIKSRTFKLSTHRFDELP